MFPGNDWKSPASESWPESEKGSKEDLDGNRNEFVFSKTST